VIPEGLTAGFDMHFSCPAVGPIKRTVAFTVNDKHTFKVGVISIRYSVLSQMTWHPVAGCV
jgi:hypothetical protein